jgi:hypothetical protein
VLIRNTNLVKQPQQIVTTKVRLEPAKQRVDFLGQVLGPAETVCHLVNASSKGKRGELGIGLSRGYSNGVGRIVEGTSEIVRQVSEDIAKRFWERFREAHFSNGESGPLRIVLDKFFVWVELDEFFYSFFEVGSVFLAPSELTL